MARERHRTEGSPHDRLTRLANAMLEHLEDQPEYLGERAIVFVTGLENGGIAMMGYEDDIDATADVLLHLEVMLATQGKTLMVVPVGKG